MAKTVLEMQSEFAQGALKIQPTMINPFISKEKKRKALCKMVDSLSEQTFVSYIPQIISIINMKKDICKGFADSEAQADGILKWLPRLKKYRELLIEYIKPNRTKYGLKL